MLAAPSALLFTTPACPYCPGVKQALSQLLAEGAIGALEVVDATRETARAAALGVRGVPWLKLGSLQFDGAMTLGELRSWAQRAATPQGVRDYCFEMLKSGQRAKVEALIRDNPAQSAVLAELAFDADAGMETRLGVGAVLEELQGAGLTDAMVPLLAARLVESESRHRADAAHFLSLIGGPAVQDVLRPYVDDADPEVREIVHDTLNLP